MGIWERAGYQLHSASGGQAFELLCPLSDLLQTLADAFINAMRIAPVRLEPNPKRAATAGSTINEARARPAPSMIAPFEI